MQLKSDGRPASSVHRDEWLTFPLTDEKKESDLSNPPRGLEPYGSRIRAWDPSEFHFVWKPAVKEQLNHFGGPFTNRKSPLH
ncbi:hypothetical protein Nepgr_017675 [Nepenthes gracilis]|uniref:Uncharacterized protein n=1 Tax=Nepenthes gracilis TaxID=150966 RepID=A0AAD3SS32_NEPGR|nr:hypothetical protein Nepgr_017675 [Nepenthes gracilis]